MHLTQKLGNVLLAQVKKHSLFIPLILISLNSFAQPNPAITSAADDWAAIADAALFIADVTGNDIAVSNETSIVSISPSFGTISGVTIATITGADFTNATEVTFGGVIATGFTVNNGNSYITANGGEAKKQRVVK